MKKRITISPSNFGNKRQDLIIPSLSPDTVQIDGMTVRQKLAFCGQLAEVFIFYSINGNIEGQWTELLNSDLSVFSARILEKDNSQFFSDFTSFNNAIKCNENQCLNTLFVQNYFKSIFSVLIEINEWYIKTHKDFFKNKIYKLLSEAIEEKGKILLADIYKIYFGYCENHQNFKNQGLKDFSTLTIEWHFDPFPYLTDDEISYYSNLCYVIDAAKQVGTKIFTFMNSLLKKIAVIYDNSLLRSDITSHIGLLLTFLDLIKHSGSNLNNLTNKHLNFYYQKILKLSASEACADETFLSLVIAKGKQEVSLVAATLFQAGNNLLLVKVPLHSKIRLKITLD